MHQYWNIVSRCESVLDQSFSACRTYSDRRIPSFLKLELGLSPDILYVNNLQTGSTLDYTLAYLSAILDTIRAKWNSPSKTGLIEITTSKEFHRIYSGIQFV